MTFSSLCREPLSIGGAKPDALVKPTSESAHAVPEVHAANPPPEAARAETDVTSGGRVPLDAAPLVADLDPSASGGGDEVMVEAFEATPRSRADTGGSAFLLPSSSVVETAKDRAMALVMASLPGPRQSTLESTPPYSGPVLVRLDASGHFPLAVLAEKRAKEQLADIPLLRSSVEHALADAAWEVATLKRELDAAKGMVFFPRHLLP